MALSNQEIENLVFTKFVKNHRFQEIYDLEDWKQRDKPDIWCKCKDSERYFELTDNTDQQLRQYMNDPKNKKVKYEPWRIQVFPSKYQDKFGKQYQTNNKQCDLIVYFGLYPVEFSERRFSEELNKNIGEIIIDIEKSPFESVWIFDYEKDKILQKINRTPKGLKFTEW